MDRWTNLAGAMILCGTTALAAQTPRHATDPIFARAQAMVSDGNGAAGRALIDSVISATPTGAPLYPQALFWRASLASNAADAESDYRHIVVDYPLAPQAEDALLRLAQLELARGDREGALIHLQRIQRDYPRSKSLARANYWTARVLFEQNDLPRACTANARALAQTDSGEIELRNQIQYQGQRCPAAVIAVETVVAEPASMLPAGTASTGVEVPRPVATKPGASTASSTQATTEHVAHPSPPEPVASSKPEPVARSKPEPIRPSKSGAGIAYSVQVAAYTHQADAEKLASTLSKRGYTARVDGSIAPFRVRIGRYATKDDAEDSLKTLKSKHMDGFVVRAPER